MSRTAQATAARIELPNATVEAHAMVHVMTSTAIMIVEIIFTFAVACDRHRNGPCCQVARLPLPRGGHCQPYGIRCPHGWHALGSRSR